MVTDPYKRLYVLQIPYGRLYVFPTSYVRAYVLPNLYVRLYVLANLYVCLYVLPTFYVHWFVNRRKIRTTQTTGTPPSCHTHQSILHHGHDPPWLGISSVTTLGVLCTPTVLLGNQRTYKFWNTYKRTHNFGSGHTSNFLPKDHVFFFFNVDLEYTYAVNKMS